MKHLPDYYFDDIYKISPDFFKSRGIKAVICDIDNTLVTYDDPIPTEKVSEWLNIMRESGISIILLSNNHSPRVSKFANAADLPYYCEAKKPCTKVLLTALAEGGFVPSEAASLGDQIFTDMIAGKRSGLTTVLVPPIKDRTDLFHRIKRLGEMPIIKSYFKANGNVKQYENWLIKTYYKKGK